MSEENKLLKLTKDETFIIINKDASNSSTSTKRKEIEKTANKRKKLKISNIKRKNEDEILSLYDASADTKVNSKEMNSSKQLLEPFSRNEKKVLPYIITNEYVLSMIQNTVNLEPGFVEEVADIPKTQKFTRSRAKEMKQKHKFLLPGLFSFLTEKVSNLIREKELQDKNLENKDSKSCIEVKDKNSTTISKLSPNTLVEETKVPEIPKDVCDTDFESVIWQNFVSQFINHIDADDLENDADYQITEDVLLDSDELKYEEISSNELKDLVAEIFEDAVQEISVLDNKEREEPNLFIKSEEAPLKTSIMPLSIGNAISMGMTSDERLQLDEQMRMHVQFLSQSYLLSHENADFHYITVSSKVLLDQIKMYAMQKRIIDQKSAFYTQNLDEALAIVNEFENITTPLNMSERKIKVPSVPSHVRKTLVTNKVFIYPELLPICGFRNNAEIGKYFTGPEDNLIAHGLEVFAEHPYPVEYIHNYLLPTKSVDQIKLRIRNSRKTKIPITNPIKFYFENKKAPQVQRVVRIFDPNNVKAPKDYSPEFLPKWMESYTKPSKIYHAISVLAPSVQLPCKIKELRKCVKPLEQPKKFSPILPRGMHFSPLKQISPILKKYSQQRRIVPIDSFNSNSPLKKSPYKALRPKPNFSIEKTSDLTSDVSSSNSQLLKIHINQDIHTTSVTCTAVQTSEGGISTNPADEENQTTACSSSPTEKTVCGSPKMETSETETFDEVDEEVIEDEQESICAVATTKKHSISKKRIRHQRDLEASLALLQPNLIKDDPMNEEREVMFANSYLLRATEILKGNSEVYEQFLSTLSKYHLNDGSAVELYSELKGILKEYPTLVRDFIVFLSPEQAKECGKYKECIILNKIRDLFRKIEIHFKNQPQHITRILKVFTQLQQQADITSADVINTLQPLLRNQTHLMEELNNLLPDVAPPEYLMTDFEDVAIPNSDDDDSSIDSCEEIIIPDTPDPYGGKDCPCNCHTSTTDNRLLNRIRHCVKCGVKFIDGRIYIQTGKVLKPAQVIYHDLPPKSPKMEKTISEQKCLKTFQTSEAPTKSQLETEICLKSSSSKSQQLTDIAIKLMQTKATVQETALKCTPINEKSCKPDVVFPKIENVKVSDTIEKEVLPSCNPNIPSTSKLPCDVLEDAVFPTENTSSLNKTTPSDFSQIRDMIGTSKKEQITIDDNQSTSSRQNTQWTRDEDKLIIYNCQRYGITKKAICETATAVKTRTVQEVLNRFMYLMVFLSKVIKKQ